MPRFAANLSMMFNEVDFLDRFGAAAKAGFKGVEFLFPYDFEAGEIAARLADNGLTLALFNLPPGDWAGGERGIASLPGREADFDAYLERALPYVETLKPPRVHMMGGIPAADAEPAACRASYLRNLQAAAKAMAPLGVDVIVEPINQRDMPGFYLSRQDQGIELLDACGADNVALQMDFYHCQIVEGDLAMTLRKNLPRIGHIQIAGVPERHEPDIGEINHPYLFALMDELGYEGWVGCEYRPKGATVDGLGWAKAWLGR